MTDPTGLREVRGDSPEDDEREDREVRRREREREERDNNKRQETSEEIPVTPFEQERYQSVIEQEQYQLAMEQEFADIMRSLRGTPYESYGESWDGADCSGTVFAVLDKMGFDIERYTASDLANGEPKWLDILDNVDNERQGDPGILNFYDIVNKGEVDHVNAGVGQISGESGPQVIDATFGNWMLSRNSNKSQQIHTAKENTINQTYTPFSTNRVPTKQGRILFNRLERK